MSFKENLLQKIAIDAMARTVKSSLGPAESGRKLDRETMRRLLETGNFAYKRRRDLDLYYLAGDETGGDILVLDNDLAVYRTAEDDVALRKSPYVKEMVNIRNIVKILKDTDVVISKKEASVEAVQAARVGMLDLSFQESDLKEIEAEGAAALENGYAEGVRESLCLFAELLAWQPPPRPFRMRHHEIMGAAREKPGGEILYGPLAIYSLAHNQLKLIDYPVSNLDKNKIRTVHGIIEGKEDAPMEGPSVLEYLRGRVSKTSPA